jgi:hypothetical protein
LAAIAAIFGATAGCGAVFEFEELAVLGCGAGVFAWPCCCALFVGDDDARVSFEAPVDNSDAAFALVLGTRVTPDFASFDAGAGARAGMPTPLVDCVVTCCDTPAAPFVFAFGAGWLCDADFCRVEDAFDAPL